MSRRTKRYIPVSSLNESKYQLNMARYNQERYMLNNTSANNAPSADNPFNTALNAEVIYSDKALLTTPSRVIQKYENSNPRPNDIALYNTKNLYTSLNAEDEIGKYLENSLTNMVRNKVQQSNKSLQTIGYNQYNMNGNGTSYNPELPYTNSNQPKSDVEFRYVDNRMQQFTNERPWNNESDRIRTAANLQRSPEIIERNRRQAETDRVLRGNALIPARIEPKVAYNIREYNPSFTIDDVTARNTSIFSDRKQLTDKQQQEAFIHRTEFNLDNTNKLMSEIDYVFSPEFNRNTDTIFRKEARLEQFNIDDHNMNAPKGFINTVTDTIYESITSLFSTKKTNVHSNDVRMSTDPSVNRAVDMIDGNTNFEQQKERYYYKPDHYVLTKTGNIPEVFPDDVEGNTALSSIMKNPIDNNIVRTIVLHNRDNISIIQKRAGDAVFKGDNQMFGNDYIEVNVPLDYFNKQFRDKLNVRNKLRDTNVVDLEYKDFIVLNEFVDRHVELQKRSKKSDVKKKFRTNDYNLDMLNNYDTRKTFVDETIYGGLANDARHVNKEKYVGRFNREQLDVSTTEYNPSPVSSHDVRKDVSQPYSIRGKGVDVKRF